MHKSERLKKLEAELEAHCDGRKCSDCELHDPLRDAGCDFRVWPEAMMEDALRRIKGKTGTADADTVDHPSHYAAGGYECINVMLDIFSKELVQHFCVINAFKYIWRHRKKGKPVEDIKKAAWYLQKYIELEEK